MLKNKKPQSDYEHLTEEEWADTIQRHVDQLDRVVTEAMRTAIRDYVVTVFAGAWGPDLKLVGDVLDTFRDHFADKNLARELDRRALFDRKCRR
jgi:hypothetical protein